MSAVQNWDIAAFDEEITSDRNKNKSRVVARKPRDARVFLQTVTFLIVICLSLRKVKAVIAPAFIYRLKAD